MVQRSVSMGELVRLQHTAQPQFSHQQASQMIVRTSQLLAHQMARCAPPVSKPQPDAINLAQMRDALFSDFGLDLCNATAQFGKIQSQMRQLSLPADYPLFTFPSVEVPLLDSKRHAPKYCVPVPMGLAKLVLADIYRQKYGINIVPVIAPRPVAAKRYENWSEWLDRALGPVGTASRTVGLVLGAGNIPRYEAHPMMYEDHVVPLIVHEQDGQLEIVNLDSLGEGGRNFIRMLHALKTDGKVYRAACLSTCRQADERSCHTDAMQILKDVLVQFKHSGETSLFAFLGIKPSEQSEDDPLTIFHLPPAFQKTTQRSAALREDNYRAAVLLDPLRYSARSNGKPLTIGQHRDKYHLPFDCRSRQFAVRQARPVNQFLTVKAYYNAQRVLDRIKSRGDRYAQSDYIRQLLERV
ncbi:MAG TPA: hypothetical protein VFV39_07695 [Limnobacter sp.]|nr:hypothetical protein [Limnobacter sp.]